MSTPKFTSDVDYQQANILIDSDCRARLADFGLAVVIDETTVGSTPNRRGVGGTTRWMAPEAMYPEKFGFAGGKYRKRLPSKSTDTYALGMTIFEVSTFSPQFPHAEIFYGPSCRLSRSVVRSTTSLGTRLLYTRSSKGADRTDRLQGSLIGCGSCWRGLGP